MSSYVNRDRKRAERNAEMLREEETREWTTSEISWKYDDDITDKDRNKAIGLMLERMGLVAMRTVCNHEGFENEIELVEVQK